MATLEQRLKKLEAPRECGLKPLPLIVDENTTDAEIERLRRGRRAVFRFGDPALFDECV